MNNLNNFEQYIKEHNLNVKLNDVALETSDKILVGIESNETPSLVLIMDKNTEKIKESNSSENEVISALDKGEEIDLKEQRIFGKL